MITRTLIKVIRIHLLLNRLLEEAKVTNRDMSQIISMILVRGVIIRSMITDMKIKKTL